MIARDKAETELRGKHLHHWEILKSNLNQDRFYIYSARMQRRRFYEAENCFAQVFPLSAFFSPSKNVIVYSQLVLPP